MKKAWINEMVVARKKDFNPADLKALKKQLTLKVKDFDGSTEAEVFVENEHWFWIPRRFGYKALKTRGFVFKDQRVMGPDIPFEVNWDILDQPPYPHDQSILVKTVASKTKRNGFGGFAVAPTASGKTLMCSYLGARLGGKTLIVVHKSDLIKNWRESIREQIKVNGLRPLIGTIRGKLCEYGHNYPFAIAMVHSLVQKDYPPEMFAAFRTVIIDECLAGDTVVQTDVGPRRIDHSSLASRLVLSYNESSGDLEMRKVKRWLPRGVRKTYTVRFRSGLGLRATKRTPFWTPTGWVMLADLKPGNAVAIANVAAERGFCPTAVVGPDGTSLDTSAGALASIGMRVWDGSPWRPLSARVDVKNPSVYRVGGVRIGSTSKHTGNLILPAQATTLGVGAPFRTPFTAHSMELSSEIAPLAGRMVEVNTHVLEALTEHPSVIMQNGKPPFLRHSGEACTRQKTEDSAQCRSCTSQPVSLDSLGLPRWFGQNEDVSALVPIGYCASTREVAPCGLWTTEQEAARSAFARTVLHEMNANASQNGFQCSAMGPRGLTVERVNTGWSGFYLSRLDGGDVTIGDSLASQWPTSFDRIESIESHKEELVYDLEVEGTHNFIANGILVHNCHHIPADTFLAALYRFKAKYLIGTTATLRRKDGTEKVFAHAVGDVLYTMVREGVEGRVYFQKVPFLISGKKLQAGGRVSPSKVGVAFENLEYRNTQIVEQLVKAYKAGRKILVLANTRNHLAYLFEMLPPIIRKRSGFYVGGRKEMELERVAQKQILLGTYCFKVGVPVLTKDGSVPIEQVAKGQEVLTHAGRFFEVRKRLSRDYSGKIVRLKLARLPAGLEGTAGHQVFRVNVKQCRHPSRANTKCWTTCTSACDKKHQRWRHYSIRKKSLGDIKKGDYVYVPGVQGEKRIHIEIDNMKLFGKGSAITPIPRVLPLDYPLARFIGLYIAEGSAAGGKAIRGARWSFHKKERPLINFIKEYAKIRLNLKAKEKPNGENGTDVIIYHAEIGRWLSEICGSGSANKRIPSEFFEAPLPIIRECVFGVQKGDGGFYRTRNYIGTTSKTLMRQLVPLLVGLKLWPAVERQPEGWTEFSGKKYKKKESWIIRFGEAKKLRHIIPFGQGMLVKVLDKQIETWEGPVFNLTVAQDHSYTVGGVAVGNSMAYEGMDVPELDMLALATPVKDIEQPVGRILRKHEFKMKPLVLDFVDDQITLRKWAFERARYYRREGFEIKTDIPA